MKLVVFGASGKVGHLVVDELVRRGHQVTAIVYKKTERSFSSAVEVKELDVHNRRRVVEVVKGHDAVISTLGSWGTDSQDILVSAMTGIIPAMQSYGIKRIISLTGADARIEGDKPALSSKILRKILTIVGPKIINDGEQHIKLLEKTQLDWTVIRSPKMTDGEKRQYTLSQKSSQAWDLVSRKTIASAMVDQLNTSDYINQAPIIHSR